MAGTEAVSGLLTEFRGERAPVWFLVRVGRRREQKRVSRARTPHTAQSRMVAARSRDWIYLYVSPPVLLPLPRLAHPFLLLPPALSSRFIFQPRCLSVRTLTTLGWTWPTRSPRHRHPSTLFRPPRLAGMASRDLCVLLQSPVLPYLTDPSFQTSSPPRTTRCSPTRLRRFSRGSKSAFSPLLFLPF